LLLPDRDVDAVDVGILLVDDRVDRDGSFAGLAVADDELPLSAPDRRHRVDRLDPGLQRFVNRFSRDDAGGLELDAAGFGGFDRRAAIDGIAERIDYPADQRLAYGNLDDAVRAPNNVTLAHVVGLAHHRDTDVVLLEIEHHARDAAGEFDKLTRHHGFEPVDARDTVADREHGPRLCDVDLAIVLLDFAPQDIGNFGRLDVQDCFLFLFGPAALAKSPSS